MHTYTIPPGGRPADHAGRHAVRQKGVHRRGPSGGAGKRELALLGHRFFWEPPAMELSYQLSYPSSMFAERKRHQPRGAAREWALQTAAPKGRRSQFG